MKTNPLKRAGGPGQSIWLGHVRRDRMADVIDRVPALGPRAADAKSSLRDKLLEQRASIEQHGDDLPEIRNWKWRPTP